MLCLTCLFYKGMAQEIKVNAKLDKPIIALGDQTVLRLSANLPVKGQVEFPVLSDTISAKVQIVEIGKTDTIADPQNPGMHTISRQYTITSFDAGMHVIPAFVFKTQTGSFNTLSIPLEVKSVAVDTTKAIYDIKQPIAVRYSFMDWLRDNWHWLLLGLLVVLVLVGIWFYFKKIRKVKPVVVKEFKPAIPADVAALDKLQTLRNQKLWQQDQVKQYHSELSDIVREYLEKRYRINAMEQTSDEILSGLKHMEMDGQNRNLLRQILILADLVKFAKERPMNTDNEQSMDNAIAFVSSTREHIAAPIHKENIPSTDQSQNNEDV